MRWDADALTSASGGELLRRSARPIATAFIDSRSPRRDGLFVPIVAARDGHDFIAAAVTGGASAVLTMPGRSVPEGDFTVVEVDDTLEALTQLARHMRGDDAPAGPAHVPAVAITGSNGKTTTRAMTEAVVASALSPVLCTQGNLNNHLGVPLTLLDEPHEPRSMVVELGMSAPGENDHLARIVRPRVGIITSIALEHLEFMKTIEAIADAEFEVARHVAPEGALIIPSDEPLLAERIPPGFTPRVLRVGPDADADVAIVAVEVASDERGRTRVELRLPDGARLELWLSVFGAHNARNAASAVAAGLALGVPVAGMVDALAAVVPVGDRGRVEQISAHHLLVADCYNANPGSMDAALASFAELAASGRRLVAVLGDMLELGPRAWELHAAVGALAGKLGVAVVGFGELSAATVEAAAAAGSRAVFVGTDVDAATNAVRSMLGAEPGAVLLKGSRGMRLERVAEQLRGADAAS